MQRFMVGFGQDEVQDWYAWLDCGHRQHVRHKPPFIERPWVILPAGRQQMLGQPLDCLRCNQLEIPDPWEPLGRRVDQNLREIDTHGRLSLELGTASWLHLEIQRGKLQCRIPAIEFSAVVPVGDTVNLPPDCNYQLSGQDHLQFSVQIFVPPDPLRTLYS